MLLTQLTGFHRFSMIGKPMLVFLVKGRIFVDLSDSGKRSTRLSETFPEIFQQPFHSRHRGPRCMRDLFMAERLAADAGGVVGHAGHAGDVHAGGTG
jgi:hypothetical protein